MSKNNRNRNTTVVNTNTRPARQQPPPAPASVSESIKSEDTISPTGEETTAGNDTETGQDTVIGNDDTKVDDTQPSTEPEVIEDVVEQQADVISEEVVEEEPTAEETEEVATPLYLQYVINVLKQKPTSDTEAWILFCTNFSGMGRFRDYSPDDNLFTAEQRTLIEQLIEVHNNQQ